jgi:hypothetical protein
VKYLHGSWKPVTFATSFNKNDDGIKPETDISRQETTERSLSSHSTSRQTPATEETTTRLSKASLNTLGGI